MQELIEPFVNNSFMLRALMAGVLVSAACAIVGTFVVLRGMAFIGDALAHGVLPGIAVSILLGLPGILGAALGAAVMIGGVGLVTRRWHVITVSQVAVSLCQFSILYAALRGVEGSSTSTSLLVAFGAWAVAQIGIMIPITPGGLGTVDAFMISLMTAMGVPSEYATAADLVWRAASFVPQIIVGVLCLVTWSRRAARTFAAAKPASA